MPKRAFTISSCIILFFTLYVPCLSQESKSINFFPLSAQVEAKLTKEQKSILNNANEDLNLILKGKEPTHSSFESAVWDGGTKYYKSPAYQLTAWHQIFPIGNVPATKRGVSLKFTKIAVAGPNQDISYTWLE